MSGFVSGTVTGEKLLGRRFIEAGHGEEVEVTGVGQVHDPLEMPWVHAVFPDGSTRAVPIATLNPIPADPDDVREAAEAAVAEAREGGGVIADGSAMAALADVLGMAG